MIRLAPALLLAGCARTHMPSCDVSTRDLPADEPLPDVDYTLTDLFTSLGGEWVVPAQVLDADRDVVETAALTVELSPTDAAATWTDSVPIDVVTTSVGFGEVYLSISVRCVSGVTVPATLDVAREDTTAALVADATLTASPDELAVGGASLASEAITGDGDWATITAAYAGYTEGRLDSVQLQSNGVIEVDWR